VRRTAVTARIIVGPRLALAKGVYGGNQGAGRGVRDALARRPARVHVIAADMQRAVNLLTADE
jgi:hypothetical protein